MKVQLENVGKRFQYDWIIRGISLEFSAPKQYAITGPNGSGKSTLLKMLCGHLSPSEGKIRFSKDGKAIDPNQVYQHITYAAPYIDLIEEMTLQEAIDFHQGFKNLLPGLDRDTLIERMGFEKAAKKPIRFFSSGMKQRLKLALAICSEADLLILDEPSTNLDEPSIQWYRDLLQEYAQDRLLIIASNAQVDFDFCKERVSVLNYKKRKKGKRNL